MKAFRITVLAGAVALVLGFGMTQVMAQDAATKPQDSMKSDAMKSDSMKSDAMKSDAMKSDAMKSDDMKSDAMKSDKSKSSKHHKHADKSKAAEPATPPASGT